MSAKHSVTHFHVPDILKRVHLPSLVLSRLLPSSIAKTLEKPKDLREYALQAERKALEFAGLELDKDIHIYDVPIDFQGQNFIHTVEVGRHNNDILILMPGYSGTAAYMSPLFKGLAQRFRIFHIDYLGQGLSSRPDYPCTTSEEAAQYIADAFEAWRKAMGIESFYIGGHSVGGYLAPFIALNDPKRCRGMFLMSPNGVANFSDYKPNKEWTKSLGIINTTGWMLYFRLYERLFDRKVSSYKLIRDNPISSKLFLRRYMNSLGHNKKQAYAIGDALHAMLMIPGGGEKCIHLYLRPPRLSAYLPLPELVFPQLKDMPIYCYFGVKDWNDWTRVHEYADQSQNRNVFYVPIENSGHQMTMENPDLVVEKILSDVGSA